MWEVGWFIQKTVEPQGVTPYPPNHAHSLETKLGALCPSGVFLFWRVAYGFYKKSTKMESLKVLGD